EYEGQGPVLAQVVEVLESGDEVGTVLEDAAEPVDAVAAIELPEVRRENRDLEREDRPEREGGSGRAAHSPSICKAAYPSSPSSASWRSTLSKALTVRSTSCEPWTPETSPPGQ